MTGLAELVKPEAYEVLKKIKPPKIYAQTLIGEFPKTQEQSLNYYLVGIQPRACLHALRKLSLYEKYQSFLPSIIKTSEYDDKNEILFFVLDHTLLPNTFTLTFKLPRIKAPGHYEFSFNEGIFNGLKGQINVYDFLDNGRASCIYETQAKWQGPSTKYSGSIIEFFSDALSKLSMETLFRISQF